MATFPYDAVLFDLDGTIFDSYESICQGLLTALREMNIALPEHFDVKQLIGPPLRDTLPSLLKLPEETVSEVIAAQRRYFHREGIEHFTVYTGIRKILQTLKANGVALGIATNKPYPMTLTLLRKYHLDAYFDTVAGDLQEKGLQGKAEIIRRAIPSGAKHCVMVGDRCYDIEGAHANQMDSIGVGYGYGSEEELRKAGCTAYAASLDDLYRLLCGNAEPQRGFFLSVEGPDGSGKSTQVQLLSEKLRQYGFDVYYTREPGGCPISEKIRSILLDTANMEMCDTCEALLYAASRAQHVHQVIQPMLKEGKLVLSDRFVDSSVAYQGGGRNLGVQTVQEINRPAVEGCLPDATLYLSISAQKALERRYSASRPDRLELEKVSFHERVEEAYREVIRMDPKRFLVVDADRPIREIAEDAFEQVLNRLAPLGDSWEESL